MAARASSRPRIRVAAVIVIDGRIVLVRQSRTGAPYHLLPGGGVEPGETLAAALLREVREEVGLDCRIIRPLFINDTIDPAGGRHGINITFLATVAEGAIPKPSGDLSIEGIDLVCPADLVGLDLRPPFAAALRDAAENGFSIPAEYLGALWTPECDEGR